MDYTLLEQSTEDGLHTTRLLSVEEKPFKRITKRLLSPNSLIYTPPTSLPTPPPDATSAEEEAVARETTRKQQEADRATWRADVLLDFAALEGSVARIQLLQASNEKERAKYASEKDRILGRAAAIRDSTTELRARLAEAQRVLERRKTYDALAERITSNRMLKPREDQGAALAKLDAEIAALEQESAEYKATWAERRVQFGKIVDEGRQMLRLIRDEKEEAERKEGMEGDDDGDDGGSAREGGSMVGTPRPDFGGATPVHTGQEADTLAGTKMVVQKDRLAPGMRSNSRVPSPAATEARSQDGAADADMVDLKEDEGEVHPGSDSGMEEGEEAEDGPPETMDTT